MQLQFSEVLVKWRRFFNFLAAQQGKSDMTVLEQKLELEQLKVCPCLRQILPHHACVHKAAMLFVTKSKFKVQVVFCFFFAAIHVQQKIDLRFPSIHNQNL